MANLHLLRELLMFSKTSNRKMTAVEAISEYFQHFIEDCEHTVTRDLIPLEGELRALMDNPLLDKTQNDSVCYMIQEIGLAKAEIDAEY